MGNDPRLAVKGGCDSPQLLRFICLKSVLRGCHIWPRIWRRETFIAPATSSSLFLSLLWSIQDPKQQTKQCCTFRLQAFTPLKKSMRWTNRAIVARATAFEQTFSITVLIVLLISIMTCCKRPRKCRFCLVSNVSVKLISHLV